jgi:putative glutamine amidotransferase
LLRLGQHFRALIWLRIARCEALLGWLPPALGDATILLAMTPITNRDISDVRPRIGIPWRTAKEERNAARQKLDYYFASVRQAGAEPVAVSLQLSPAQLADEFAGLDGFVLPGSPSDVDPGRYGATRHAKTTDIDENRDVTDASILAHAFASGKPVFAICYGFQALNVFLGGTLIQDIPSERPGALAHGKTDLTAGASAADLQHEARLAPGSRLATLNGSERAAINTSHHQAIGVPGKSLVVTAQAPDGIVEGVEWRGDAQWVVGVQWHPERMTNDAFAARLFQDFVAAVRSSRGTLAQSR